MIAHKEIDVIYGMGAKCSAVLPLESIEGLTARDLVVRVAQMPQTSDPASRTASVLRDIITNSNRILDIDVLRGRNGIDGHGEPIMPEDTVIPINDEITPLDEKVTIRVSESYVGG